MHDQVLYLIAAMGVTASISNIALIQDAMELETVGYMFKLAGYLVPYLLVISAFTFIYVFVPNIKVKIKSALIGAMVAGILWEAASWAFASFVVNSTKYTAIYSAFATLIIFFVWLYVNWLILLIGCSIAFYHQKPAHRHLGLKVVRLSNRNRETMALNIMMLIGQHYHSNKPAWSAETIADHMGVSADTCMHIISRLLKENILKETSDSPTSYLPAYDLDTMYLSDIMSSVRASDENEMPSFNAIKLEPAVSSIHMNVEDAITQSLKGLTLKDISINQTKD